MAWMFASIHIVLTGMIIGQAAQGIYGWVGIPGFIATELAVLVTAMALSFAWIGDTVSVEETNQVFTMYTSLFLDAVLITELLKLFVNAEKGISEILKLILKVSGSLAIMTAIEGADGGVFFLPRKNVDPILKGMFWAQLAWVVLNSIAAVTSKQIEGLNSGYYFAAGIFAILYLLTGGKFQLFKSLGE